MEEAVIRHGKTNRGGLKDHPQNPPPIGPKGQGGRIVNTMERLKEQVRAAKKQYEIAIEAVAEERRRIRKAERERDQKEKEEQQCQRSPGLKN